MQTRRHIRLLPFLGTLVVVLLAAARQSVMSFTDFIAYTSMALLAVGVYLEVEGKEQYKKNIGHFLTVISIVGLVCSGWKIAGEPFVALSLGPIQFFGFLLFGGIGGLIYWRMRDGALKEHLEILADEIGDFSSEVKKQNTNPVLLTMDKPRWRRIIRDYYKRCGKKAVHLLRRTAIRDFMGSLDAVSAPADFQGFEHAVIYLRAAALSLPDYSKHRAFRAALNGALLSAAVFFVLLFAGQHEYGQTPAAAVQITRAQPTPTVAPNINTRPHQLIVDWPDFHPSWTLDLEGRLRQLNHPCVLKISTVPEQMKFRAMLVQIATRNDVCATADDQMDGMPSVPDVDATPTPTPLPGLTIRWNKEAQPQGESIAGWFHSAGFIVNRGHALLPGSQATEIWIEIGPGFLWWQK